MLKNVRATKNKRFFSWQILNLLKKLFRGYYSLTTWTDFSGHYPYVNRIKTKLSMHFLVCIFFCKFISFTLQYSFRFSYLRNICLSKRCTRESIISISQIKILVASVSPAPGKYQNIRNQVRHRSASIFPFNLISRGTFHFKSFQSTERLSDSRTNAPWNFILRRTAQHRSETFLRAPIVTGSRVASTGERGVAQSRIASASCSNPWMRRA